MKAYLDNMATTQVDPRVVETVTARLGGVIGNPHATMHPFGRDAAAVVADARADTASVIGVRPEEVVFTPSATVADNLAVLGVARARTRKGRHIVVSSIEHPAVLMAARHLQENEGFELDLVPVGSGGVVEPDEVARLLRPDTTLVSVMALNNELGTVQPIRQIAEVVRKTRAFFHTDAAQAPGRIALDFATAVDLMTLSSHKIYGPRGAGALMVRRRRDIIIKPLFFGGGQEAGICPGTVNTSAVYGFGAAMKFAAADLMCDSQRLRILADHLIEGILGVLPGSCVVGDRGKSVPHCISVMISGMPGETFVSRLARAGVAVSLGSACHGDPALPSHVLSAVGLTPAQSRRTVRFGLGRFTTQDEIDYTIEQVRALACELSI